MKLFFATVFLCQCAKQIVLADFMYQIQVFVSASTKAVANEIKADIKTDASDIVAPFFEVKPVFSEYSPGESFEESPVDPPSNTTTDSTTGVRGLLRGMRMPRQRQMPVAGSQCPPLCALNSPNIRLCINLGCAKCSSGGCYRRLQEGGGSAAAESLTITRTEEKYILSSMNLELESYCDGIPHCSVKTAIVRIEDDGTVIENFN